MRDYTKIKAWQLADDLTVAVYEQIFISLPTLLSLPRMNGIGI